MNTNQTSADFRNAVCVILFFAIACLACRKEGKGPAIASISPQSGAMGKTVTILGSGFSSDPDLVSVTINGKPANILIATPEKLIVEVPRAAGTGNITVTINGKQTQGPVFNYLPSTTVYLYVSGGGDVDGPAPRTARISFPAGLAWDHQGNLYLCQASHKIRRIAPMAYVTSVAGSESGYRDGTGANAQFNGPHGITVDMAGNIFVVDTYNHRIRMVTPAGVVTTLAGSAQGSTDGAGTNARFSYPTGICSDAQGNLFVADQNNHRIRKITPQGVVSTFAGSSNGYADGAGTTAQFSAPTGIAIDNQGNFYVADCNNHRIRKITPGGVVSTVAGSSEGYADGAGAEAKFNKPFGICTASDGNLYVADAYNHKIRKISSAGVVSTLAGTTQGYMEGSSETAQFDSPYGIVADKMNPNVFYVADFGNGSIRKIVVE